MPKIDQEVEGFAQCIPKIRLKLWQKDKAQINQKVVKYCTKEHNVSEQTIKRVVYDDLNKKTSIKHRRQALSTVQKEKQLNRATILLDTLTQWFPTGEKFYNFKGGILQVLFCEGLWCLTASHGCLLYFFCLQFILNAILGC